MQSSGMRHIKKAITSSAAQGWGAQTLLAPLLAGHDIGLVSEAGMPAVARPRAARWCAPRTTWAAGWVPLVGAVSLLMTLAASGLNRPELALSAICPRTQASAASASRNLER